MENRSSIPADANICTLHCAAVALQGCGPEERRSSWCMYGAVPLPCGATRLRGKTVAANHWRKKRAQSPRVEMDADRYFPCGVENMYMDMYDVLAEMPAVMWPILAKHVDVQCVLYSRYSCGVTALAVSLSSVLKG